MREHLLVGVFDDVLGVTAGERGYGCHLVNAHRLHLARDGFDELLDLVLRAVPKQRDHEEAAVLRLGTTDFMISWTSETATGKYLCDG